MRPTFFGLEIGKSGLHVAQKGLDVTGHNVANSDTVGYTRQRLVNTAYEPYSVIQQFRPVERGLVGGGAHVQILDQIRSEFLDRQYRTESTALSFWSTRTQGLNYVQAIFESADKGTTIQGALENLFKGFNAVVKEPNDQMQRTNLRSQAYELTDQLNGMYTSLVAQQRDQDGTVRVIVDRINRIADQIALLNKEIYAYEMDMQPANDLRDKRNLLIDELSTYCDVEYTGQTNLNPLSPDYGETYTGIAIGDKLIVKIGGKVLVDHKYAYHLEVSSEDNSNMMNNVLGPDYADVYDIRWADFDVNDPNYPQNPDDAEPVPDEAFFLDEDDNPYDGTNTIKNITGGELLAHINLRDNIRGDTTKMGIPFFIDELNKLARSLVNWINATHNEGYTHPSSGEVSQQGVNFFYAGDRRDVTGLSYNNVDADGNIIPIGAAGKVAGIDTDGNPNTIEISGKLYTEGAYTYYDDISTVNAGNIRLDDMITGLYNGNTVETDISVFNIALANYIIDIDPVTGKPNDKQQGNNEIALELLRLEEQADLLTMVNGYEERVGSFFGFTSALVEDVALSTHHSITMTENEATLVLAADTQRTSISGVDLDEEMTNLIMYQHAYNGSSRVITTMDDALETLINRMGRVGL